MKFDNWLVLKIIYALQSVYIRKEKDAAHEKSCANLMLLEQNSNIS